MSEEKKITARGTKKQPKPKKTKQPQKTQLRVAPKPTHPDVEFMDAPSFSEIQPPPGFRVVSYSQAMMEYAGPVLDASEFQDMTELNERLRIAMTIWNHNIAGELATGPQPLEKDIVQTIGKVLNMSSQEARVKVKKPTLLL